MANLNLNKVIIAGRLTSDIELKQTPSGVFVTSFSIAVNRRPRKNEDGTQAEQQADFITCVAWRKSAELISKYFHKGSSICVVGNLQTRTWEDTNGNKRYATEVIVDEVNFVDSKSDNASYAPQTSAPTAQTLDGSKMNFEVVSNEEDLPF